eukprot:72042-Chlamydomonas_euryale.AAC.1
MTSTSAPPAAPPARHKTTTAARPAPHRRRPPFAPRGRPFRAMTSSVATTAPAPPPPSRPTDPRPTAPRRAACRCPEAARPLPPLRLRPYAAALTPARSAVPAGRRQKRLAAEMATPACRPSRQQRLLGRCLKAHARMPSRARCRHAKVAVLRRQNAAPGDDLPFRSRACR